MTKLKQKIKMEIIKYAMLRNSKRTYEFLVDKVMGIIVSHIEGTKRRDNGNSRLER